MSIRNRIIKLNIVIVAVLLLSLVASAAVFWEGTGVQYEEVLEGVMQDEDMRYTVQGYLHAYWEEIGNQFYGQNSDSIKVSNLTETKRMKRIEEYIDETGYRFAIYVGREAYINKLSQQDMQEIEKMNLFQNDGMTNNIELQENDGTNIIITTPYRKDWDITGIAIRLPGEQPVGEITTFRSTVIKYLMIACMLIVGVILGSNLFYARWLRKHILDPLVNLQKATKQISHGNLDYSIQNNASNEIGDVCRDFEQMRQQLKEAEKARQEYEAYKAELLAGISHDLRSPLTSIKGYAEGMIDGIADTPEKRERYCRAIMRRSYDMERLADSLGTYMSLETGKMQFHFERRELNEYLWEYIHKNKETEFEEWKITFETKFTEATLPVQIDRNQMNRVLNNLIQNSMKYRTKDASVIRLQTMLYTEGQNQYAVVLIADDGPGVKEASLPHIFECFYRDDSSRTKQGKGSGLGLSIVKQIIIGHHGMITAENDNGLTMKIQLPIAE